MRRIRIIPRLDVKGPNLVKGVHFEGLRVLGPPEFFAAQYYEQGADELLYMDIVASLYGRNNLRHIVERTAQNIFIPITVGGGIRTLEDIRAILRAGADKIAINTAAIQRPGLITEAAQAFGSQCVVISIEAKQMPDGRYEAFTDNGRQETGIDVLDWARHAADLGAGELLVTSVDREGTGDGYDLELIAQVVDAVPVPVIACGGAGRLEHIAAVVTHTHASAVAAASIFHYHQLKPELARRTFAEGNTEFLTKYTQTDGYQLKRIQPVSVGEVKAHMERTGAAAVRPAIAVSDRGRDAQVPSQPTGAGDAPRPRVVVVDYGCGNLCSVQHALRQIEADCEFSADPAVIARADRLIVPGVGAFGDGMAALRQRGLIEPILAHVRAGKPLLGICLGMQLLMQESEEFGRHEGLGIIPGRVVKLRRGEGASSVKVPHIGWNRLIVPSRAGDALVCPTGRPWESTVLEEVPAESYMYFVHSYMVVPEAAEDILAETEYGENRFCAVISKGQVCGSQFHPERSGQVGLAIYRRFVSWRATHEFARR